MISARYLPGTGVRLFSWGFWDLCRMGVSRSTIDSRPSCHRLHRTPFRWAKNHWQTKLSTSGLVQVIRMQTCLTYIAFSELMTKSLQGHLAHIAQSETMTITVQQVKSLGSFPTSPFAKTGTIKIPHVNSSLVGGNDKTLTLTLIQALIWTADRG